MNGKKEKPTGSLYHLSHGQREPVGFLVRSLPQSRTLHKKQTVDQWLFFTHGKGVKAFTTGGVSSYGKRLMTAA